MQPGEPILLICHAFPPIFDIGGRRWAKFAKELARRGHPVHVIRSAKEAGTPDSLWLEDGVRPGIFHHPLPRRYPAVLMQQSVSSFTDKLKYHAWTRLMPLLCKGNWYDHSVFWRKQLLAEASKLIREHGIRQVVVTGFPFRFMAYATELKKEFPQVRLTLDFRDEWTWSGNYGMASIGAYRLQFEKDLETQVIRDADKVISPHLSILEHFRSVAGDASAKYVHVPHAVDPDDFDLSPPARAEGQFRMIYAGSLYGAHEAELYFEQLLQAFEVLRDQHPGSFATCRLDLFITGLDTHRYQEKVAARNLSQQICFRPSLPPKEVFRQIRDSNLVILFIPSGNRDILGTKFMEIFFVGTPILHVGEPGLVSDTIQKRHMGASIRVEELKVELPRIISGERKVEVDRNADHSAYLLPNITDRLIAEVLT